MSKFYDRYKKREREKYFQYLETERDPKVNIIRAITLFGNLEKRCRIFIKNKKYRYGV